MSERLINRTISVLYRNNQSFFAHKIKEYSLPIDLGQIPSLVQVYRHPGITQDEISSNAGIDKGTAARTVKQLENAGLVIRTTDEKDRRVNHITATPEGQEAGKKIFQIIRELHQILYQGFSDKEISAAISLLERMKDNIKDYLKSW